MIHVLFSPDISRAEALGMAVLVGGLVANDYVTIGAGFAVMLISFIFRRHIADNTIRGVRQHFQMIQEATEDLHDRYEALLRYTEWDDKAVRRQMAIDRACTDAPPPRHQSGAGRVPETRH